MTEGKNDKMYVNYKYILEEIKDELEKSLKNIHEVITLQEKVLSLIENEKEVENFVNSTREVINKYKEQSKIIFYRLECIKDAIEMLDDTKIAYTVYTLLEALGIANQQAKTFEEREENKEEVLVY